MGEVAGGAFVEGEKRERFGGAEVGFSRASWATRGCTPWLGAGYAGVWNEGVGDVIEFDSQGGAGSREGGAGSWEENGVRRSPFGARRSAIGVRNCNVSGFGGGVEGVEGGGVGAGGFELEAFGVFPEFAFAVGAGFRAAGAAALGEGAGAGFDGRQEAEQICLLVDVADVLVQVVKEALGVALALLHFLFGEPAGGGKVFRAGDGGQVEELAVLVEEKFVEGPGGRGAVGGAVRLVGTEGFAVGRDGDFGDRLLGGRGLDSGFGARGDGAGQGAGGDLTGVGEGAGGVLVDGAGEKAMGDLGEDELDGGVVFEKGHDDFGTFGGQLGVTEVGVGVAEVVAAQGGGVALETADGEVAAAAVFIGSGGGGCGFWSFGFWSCGFWSCGFWSCGRGRLRVEHGFPFEEVVVGSR